MSNIDRIDSLLLMKSYIVVSNIQLLIVFRFGMKIENLHLDINDSARSDLRLVTEKKTKYSLEADKDIQTL